MRYVADDRYPQAFERGPIVENRDGVEQGLGGVFVLAVAGIHNRRF